MLKRMMTICLVGMVGSSLAWGTPTPYTGTETGLRELYHLEDTFAANSSVVAAVGTNAAVNATASSSVAGMTGFGNALKVASSSEIKRPSGGDWNNGESDSSFTAECWVKWGKGEYLTSGIEGLLYAGTGGSPGQYEWRIYSENGTMYFYVSNGVSHNAAAYAFTPVDDTWYHIAATHKKNEGGQGISKLYITPAGTENAVLRDTYTGIWMSSVGKSEPLVIGNFAYVQDSRYLRGTIDEVAIFDYAKEASEFTTLVPEPATFGLLVLGFGLLRRRRK